jgi:orotidine-5'-phosphate decarboxylase
MKFADKLQASINRSHSAVVAGLDPRLEAFPRCILKEAEAESSTTEEAIYLALTAFHSLALEALAPSIAAVKPNLAFFESYGLGGLRAFAAICQMAREHRLPLIADGKRGDIGSTAQAYSAAFLGRSKFFGKEEPIYDADALTVNPYLGFDTMEPFLADCAAYGKGIFVLVKTSNPGSADIQNIQADEAHTISDKIAHWAAAHAKELQGDCGYSGLGAVVGATYPEEARRLRQVMPTNFFLIPGMGAQGGTAQDAVAGFSKKKGGAVINISRALLSTFSSKDIDRVRMADELKEKITAFNSQIAESLNAAL